MADQSTLAKAERTPKPIKPAKPPKPPKPPKPDTPRHGWVNWWRTGASLLRDGTFMEVERALRHVEPSYVEDRMERDDNDFVVLKNETFITRKADSYRALVSDLTAWEEFSSQTLSKYFNDKIRMFPYERADVATDMSAHGKISDFEAPGRFFRVQKEMLERRFPSGRNQTAGDADLRDQVSALRLLFFRNFRRLIVDRRVIAREWIDFALIALAAQTTLAAIVWIFGGMIGLPVILLMFVAILLALIAPGIAVFGVWRSYDRFEILKDQYEAAVRSSCQILGRNLQIRQQDTIANIPLLFKASEDQKFELKNQNRLSDWPKEVAKWTSLTFWLAGRVEANELFMQIEMWRIRRLHYGLKWLAGLRSIWLGLRALALYVLALGVTGSVVIFLNAIWGAKATAPAAVDLGADAVELTKAVFSTSSDPWLFPVVLVTGAAWVVVPILALVLVQGTNNRSLVDLDLIERAIKTDEIQGFKDVALYKKVADQMVRDREFLLQEEDKLKR